MAVAQTAEALPPVEKLRDAAALLRQISPSLIQGDLVGQPELLELRDAGKERYGFLLVDRELSTSSLDRPRSFAGSLWSIHHAGAVRRKGRRRIPQRAGATLSCTSSVEPSPPVPVPSKAGHQKLLRKLEKLQKEINREHDLRVNASKKAEINAQREARLAAIEASCDTATDSRPHVLGLKPAQIKMLAASGQLKSSGSPEEGMLEQEGDMVVHSAGVADGDGEEEGENGSNGLSEVQRAAELPRGSFRRRCGVCKCAYTELHEFYHLVSPPTQIIALTTPTCQMCPTCAEFNWERRVRSADMKGMVAVVTGGRIRIGYRIVLKLLRAGACPLLSHVLPNVGSLPSVEC